MDIFTLFLSTPSSSRVFVSCNPSTLTYIGSILFHVPSTLSSSIWHLSCINFLLTNAGGSTNRVRTNFLINFATKTVVTLYSKAADQNCTYTWRFRWWRFRWQTLLHDQSHLSGGGSQIRWSAPVIVNPGPSPITRSTSVLELSTRNFYNELSLSTTIRRTQTQLKNGGIVLMKLE